MGSEEPLPETGPPPGTEPRTPIVLRGVRKSFGPKTVLDGLDLEVRKSEILVILGRSGAASCGPTRGA